MVNVWKIATNSVKCQFMHASLGVKCQKLSSFEGCAFWCTYSQQWESPSCLFPPGEKISQDKAKQRWHMSKNGGTIQKLCRSRRSCLVQMPVRKPTVWNRHEPGLIIFSKLLNSLNSTVLFLSSEQNHSLNLKFLKLHYNINFI